jgi:signal transduction histidine kinase
VCQRRRVIPPRTDLLAGAAVTAVVLADLALVERPAEGVAVTTVAAVVLGAATALRRSRPLAVALLLAVVLLGQTLLGGQLTHMLSTGIVAAGLVFSTALHLPRRPARAGAAAVLAASWVDLLVEQLGEYPLVSDLVFTGVVVVGGPFLAGRALRERRETSDRLEALAAQLAAEREQLAQLAVADERTRIAREMHDVVAHSVSLMVVQAGAARRMLDARPERSRDALLAVEDVGRQALAELRRILGLLREEEGPDELAPMPGLAQLPGLVDTTRASGLDVAVVVTGVPRPLPPGVDLAVYRVVQEALTNTLKHARATSARVLLQWEDAALRFAVVDDGVVPEVPPQGGGHGLVGMRERVAVCGGDLTAGREERGFAVRAVVPLERGAVPA